MSARPRRGTAAALVTLVALLAAALPAGARAADAPPSKPSITAETAIVIDGRTG